MSVVLRTGTEMSHAELSVGMRWGLAGRRVGHGDDSSGAAVTGSVRQSVSGAASDGSTRTGRREAARSDRSASHALRRRSGCLREAGRLAPDSPAARVRSWVKPARLMNPPRLRPGRPRLNRRPPQEMHSPFRSGLFGDGDWRGFWVCTLKYCRASGCRLRVRNPSGRPGVIWIGPAAGRNTSGQIPTGRFPLAGARGGAGQRARVSRSVR